MRPMAFSGDKVEWTTSFRLLVNAALLHILFALLSVGYNVRSDSFGVAAITLFDLYFRLDHRTIGVYRAAESPSERDRRSE